MVDFLVDLPITTSIRECHGVVANVLHLVWAYGWLGFRRDLLTEAFIMFMSLVSGIWHLGKGLDWFNGGH